MKVTDGVLVWMVAPAAPVVAKELREKAVLGANIQKDGHDPPILADRLVLGLSFFFGSPFLSQFYCQLSLVTWIRHINIKVNVEDHHQSQFHCRLVSSGLHPWWLGSGATTERWTYWITIQVQFYVMECDMECDGSPKLGHWTTCLMHHWEGAESESTLACEFELTCG